MCSWQPHLQIPLLWWWLQATHLVGAGGSGAICVTGVAGSSSVLPMMRGMVVRSLGEAQSRSCHTTLAEWFPGCPPGMSHRSLVPHLYAQHCRISVIVSPCLGWVGEEGNKDPLLPPAHLSGTRGGDQTGSLLADFSDIHSGISYFFKRVYGRWGYFYPSDLIFAC